MGDWIGLAFFVLLIVGIFIGLKILSKPQNKTEEEFERGISESGSLLSAGVSALNGILNPSATKEKKRFEN